MKTYTATDFRSMPWKNGQGTTLELYRLESAGGELLLRLSIARVDVDGPFSHYPGIDRLLVILQGTLFCAGQRLCPGDPPWSFPGELSVTGELLEGPVQDLNVMTARHWGTSTLELVRGPISLDGAGSTLALNLRKMELRVYDHEVPDLPDGDWWIVRTHLK